jgi:hypothetical protein
MQNNWCANFFVLSTGSGNFLNATREYLAGEKISSHFDYEYSKIKELWNDKLISYVNSKYDKKGNKEFKKYDWINDWDTLVLLCSSFYSAKFKIKYKPYLYKLIERKNEGGDVDDVLEFSKSIADTVNLINNIGFNITKKEIKSWEKTIEEMVTNDLEWLDLNSLKEYELKFNKGKSMQYKLTELIM